MTQAKERMILRGIRQIIFLMVMQKEISGQYRRWMPALLRDGSGEMERVLQRVWSN